MGWGPTVADVRRLLPAGHGLLCSQPVQAPPHCPQQAGSHCNTVRLSYGVQQYQLRGKSRDIRVCLSAPFALQHGYESSGCSDSRVSDVRSPLQLAACQLQRLGSILVREVSGYRYILVIKICLQSGTTVVSRETDIPFRCSNQPNSVALRTRTRTTSCMHPRCHRGILL